MSHAQKGGHRWEGRVIGPRLPALYCPSVPCVRGSAVQTEKTRSLSLGAHTRLGDGPAEPWAALGSMHRLRAQRTGPDLAGRSEW